MELVYGHINSSVRLSKNTLTVEINRAQPSAARIIVKYSLKKLIASELELFMIDIELALLIIDVELEPFIFEIELDDADILKQL